MSKQEDMTHDKFFYFDIRKLTYIGLLLKHVFHSTLQKLFTIQNKATFNFTYSPWLLPSFSLVAWFSLNHVTLIFSKLPSNL